MKSKLKSSFKNIIDSYLSGRESFSSYHARIERGKLIGFHPSGLHNACPRKIAYLFLYERGQLKEDIIEDDLEFENNPPQLERTFDTGHAIHMLIQYGYLPDYAKKAKIDFAVEVPATKLYAKYLISGTADVVIKLQDEEFYLVDIKTARSEMFYKFKDIGSVAKNYIVQGNLYMLGIGLSRYIIYYWNKNDGDHKEFIMNYDKQIVAKSLQTCLEAKDYLLGKSIPEVIPDCQNFSKKFTSCEFSSICVRQKKAKDILNITDETDHLKLIEPMHRKN